jgi:hypothetical protein
MDGQRPSIGRIVNYTNLGDKDGKYPPEIQAALITGVYFQAPRAEGAPETEPGASANKVGDKSSSMFVDLKIFYRSGFFDMQKVPYAAEPTRGHWNWPPRV